MISVDERDAQELGSDISGGGDTVLTRDLDRERVRQSFTSACVSGGLLRGTNRPTRHGLLSCGRCAEELIFKLPACVVRRSGDVVGHEHGGTEIEADRLRVGVSAGGAGALDAQATSSRVET